MQVIVGILRTWMEIFSLLIICFGCQILNYEGDTQLYFFYHNTPKVIDISRRNVLYKLNMECIDVGKYF